MLRRALLALLLATPAPGPHAVAGDAPELDRPRAILAQVDPAILAAPAPLSAPLVFAHGNLGIPRVITWSATTGVAGIAWGSTAQIAAANAYVTYDATDMLLNVPTGDGFQFLVNNVAVGGFNTGGDWRTNVIQILSGTTLTIEDADGNAGPVFTDAGTTITTALDGNLTAGGLTLNTATVRFDSGTSLAASYGQLGGGSATAVIHSQVADGAGAVAIRLAATGDYVTAGAKILSVGDSAGSVYVEKAYINLFGGIHSESNIDGVNLIATTSVKITDTNVQISESGTNDMALTADGAVSMVLSGGGTADVLLSGNARINGGANLFLDADGGGVEIHDAAVPVALFNIVSGSAQMLLDNDVDETLEVNAASGWQFDTATGNTFTWRVADAASMTLTAGLVTLNVVNTQIHFGSDATYIAEDDTDDLVFTADSNGIMRLDGAKATIFGNLRVNGGLASDGVTTVKTGTYVATEADFLIPVSINGGSFTSTLPSAAAAPGQILKYKCTDVHAANVLTVQRAGSDTIVTQAAAAATSFTMCAAATYSYVELVNDGASVWYMTGFSL